MSTEDGRRNSGTPKTFLGTNSRAQMDIGMQTARLFVGNSFLDNLQTNDYALLEPHLIEKKLERDFTVNNPGDRVETVYFPNGAILSVITLMEDGRGVESSTIGRESVQGVLAAFGSHKAYNRVICQVPGRCFTMPVARLKEAAAKSSVIADELIRYVQGNNAQTEQSVACNALHSVEERLCRWILLSADRGDGRVVALTQEYLAIMLGVQRTTVTQAARTLQAEGMINYSRGSIEIVNRGGLEDTVCECYDIVKQKFHMLTGNGPVAYPTPTMDVA